MGDTSKGSAISTVRRVDMGRAQDRKKTAVGRALVIAVFLWVSVWPAAGAEGASSVEIDREASVFAVVTHKAGLAARLAHNHLVIASDYEVTLDFDPEKPEATSFRFEAPAAKLKVDDPAAQKRWYPRIAELGILSEPFGEVPEGDRKKIYDSMVSKKQLNVQSHPTIRAEIVGVSGAGDSGTEGFPFSVRLRIEIVGKSVEKTVAGRFERDGNRIRFEAFGEPAFTDFEIKPYSAMLGAVKNDDPFHLYVVFEGRLSPSSEPEPAQQP